MSVYRIFDEILVVLNNSTDGTRALVEDLMRDHPKIRLEFYDRDCSAAGVGYYERVRTEPESSLAKYYNWCLERTTFSHVCKWDGDMIGLPTFEQVASNLQKYDIVMFDGYDVLGEYTTDLEARIFRYDLAHARYVDWDLYEILQHDYVNVRRIDEKCYLHLKLVKQDWVHRQWVCPNVFAARSVPDQGGLPSQGQMRAGGVLRRLLGRLRRGVSRLG